MPLALQANDANVGADPDHLPVVAAAGVLLFQSDYVSEVNIRHRKNTKFQAPNTKQYVNFKKQ
jgi:hypothetical protein